MPPDSDNVPDSQVASISMTVGDRQLNLQMAVTNLPARPANFLPLYRSIADSLVNIAVQTVESAGAKISCRNNCGACCRQPVPITEMEARRIRDLVEEMPEPRRSELRARFAAARETFDKAGLLPRLLNPESITPEDRVSFILNYFKQGVACPFLENESCSIYSERPVACREFLVVSPVENCANLSPDGIKSVKVKGDVPRAMAMIGNSGGVRKWVPLIMANEWAEAHPEDASERPGMEIVKEFFDNLCDEEKAESEERRGMGL